MCRVCYVPSWPDTFYSLFLTYKVESSLCLPCQQNRPHTVAYVRKALLHSRYCAWRQNLLHWDKRIQQLQMIFKIQFSQRVKRYVHFFYSVQAHVSYYPPYFWMLFLKIRFFSNLSDLIIVLWIKDGSFNVDIKKLVNNSVTWWKFTW